ncbi:MAG: polysaccharide biosynthesis C-terminal domain-containing protein [Bacteroidota bacterium]
MVNKILGTIGTRMINAILAFVIWILNAHYLGPEKVGTIFLIIFSVSIIQLFINFVGGAALIYLTPRTGIFKLIVPAYIWTFLVTILCSALLSFIAAIFPVLEVIPAGYFWQVLFLALIMSFASVNFMLLLGLEKVKTYNYINLVQIIVLFLILLFCLFGLRLIDVMAYYWAILISYSIAFLISFYLLWPSFRKVPLTKMKSLLMEILRFGTYVQFANIFQTLNYRLSLKFVDFFSGRAAVGVLSIGLTLAEGLWLISRSIAMVQYSRLSNEMNYDYSVRLTLTFAKITWVVTGIAMLLLLAVPNFIFTALFSARFGDIKMVIASLAIGIVTLSVSMIFSGFFSSINKPYHNTISSAIGLVFTIVFGFILIPGYGIIGAGISATFSYTFATIYQFIVFSRMTKLRLRDFLITKTEVRLLSGEIRRILTNPTPP